jgi:hypothetical protein
MNIKKTQLIKAFLAFVITVTVLFTVKNLWMDYAVASPLDKVLKEINGVSAVSLENTKKFSEAVIVNVTLDNNIVLEKIYSEINSQIAETLNNKPYTLHIKDNRTPELEEIYYEVNLYIQKAIIDGNFPLLEQNIREKAEARGAIGRVFVDNENIYLQLSKNDNCLYSIISRPSSYVGGDI